MAGRRSWARRWTQRGIAGLLLVALGVLWWQAPALYEGSGADLNAQATATATTRAGILAVMVATIAAVGAWASLSETRRANLAADQRERYTSAITQIGDDKLDVRLGGLYGLERIAEDSPRDVPTIVEVLCAFARGHGQRPDDGSPQALEKPRIDVQAAVTVVGRVRRHVRGAYADLSGIHIERVNLNDADLSGALLINATLTYANLADARLTRAHLNRTNLAGAYLWRANLFGANLERADLKGAELNRANLKGARLADASMAGARMELTNLTRAVLTRVVLANAALTKAILSRASLIGADLTNALLKDADLTYALLKDAELTGANLSGANLSGADLSGALGLTQDQLDRAKGDLSTQLPPGLTRPSGWTSPAAEVDSAQPHD